MTSMQTNRRHMLLGLAAASTAAASGTAATGATAPKEASELLSLADGLADALQSYKDAEEMVNRIVQEWGPQWPVPDMEIVRYGLGCKSHRDILGRGIETEWGKSGVMRVQDLGTPEYFEESAKGAWTEYERKMRTKSKRGAKFARRQAEREAALVEPARAYWSEAERITEASGIEAARASKRSAMEALRSLVGEIVTFREKTITGLIIKAQAMLAWEQVRDFDRLTNLEVLEWADAMTATVLRQTA